MDSKILLLLGILHSLQLAYAANPICYVCSDGGVSTITKPDVVVPLPETTGQSEATCEIIRLSAEVLLLIPEESCILFDREDFRTLCGCENALVSTSTPPSASPVALPAPTLSPSGLPTIQVVQETESPSSILSLRPSTAPTLMTTSPISKPSFRPSSAPTLATTTSPSSSPSFRPSTAPTLTPTVAPIATSSPVTLAPTTTPTVSPTATKTVKPTKAPTKAPTSDHPSSFPSESPSDVPSEYPSTIPSTVPSFVPTYTASLMPSYAPSEFPVVLSSKEPTLVPSDILEADDEGSSPADTDIPLLKKFIRTVLGGL